MNEPELYTSGELKEVKNPSINLHSNGPKPLTKREKLEMVVSSKTFTVAATVCSFGLYYLYYLFCLEQEQDSPFIFREGKKYTYERPEEADPVYQEAQQINQRMSNFASGKDNRTFSESLLKSSKEWFEKWKLLASVGLSNILTSIESAVIKLTGKGQTEKSEEEQEAAEENTRVPVIQKMEKLADEQVEFDISKSLAASLSCRRPKPKKDHYLTFVFLVTYIFVSLLTLGIFPVYHLLIKDRWDDFKNINKHKEHSCIREFDDMTNKLMGMDGGVEYSYLLLGKKGLPLNLNFFSDAFRTRVFGVHSIRSRIITFLMVITLGLFGTFVLSKNVFDDNRLDISVEDSKPTDYLGIEDKWERFKMFLIDLFRDIGIASRIAAKRVATINRSVADLFGDGGREEGLMVRFIRLLSSPMYFWLFSFVFFLSSLSFMIIYASWYPEFYGYFTFWAALGLFLTFIGLFTRHINLLFI